MDIDNTAIVLSRNPFSSTGKSLSIFKDAVNQEQRSKDIICATVISEAGTVPEILLKLPLASARPNFIFNKKGVSKYPAELSSSTEGLNNLW